MRVGWGQENAPRKMVVVRVAPADKLAARRLRCVVGAVLLSVGAAVARSRLCSSAGAS